MKTLSPIRQLRALAMLFALLASPVGVAAETRTEAANTLRLGSVAMDIPAVMHRRLTPLTQYLGETLKRPVELHLSPNMPHAIEQLASGKVDLAYLTPVAYLKAHERGQAQLVVKTVTQGKGSFQLMVVVQEAGAIRSIDDLRGKRFAFGDKAAILQRAVVVGAGMPIEQLGDHHFIGHYDNIARAVLSGDFDAGILKDTAALKWEGKGLRILHRSPDLPPYNIAARRDLDAKVIAQVRAAFLSLDANRPEHRAIIQALDSTYDGFAPTDDKEYEAIRRLIAPFK